jgi:hypothetical protein
MYTRDSNYELLPILAESLERLERFRTTSDPNQFRTREICVHTNNTVATSVRQKSFPGWRF